MMKKYRTRILSILLAVCLTVSISVPAFAAESNTDTSSPLSADAVIDSIIYPVAFGDTEISALETFQAMTVDELDAYISNLANGIQPASIDNTSSLSNSYLGWLAAAVIIHKLGLDCTYIMLLYSLEDEDYTETNGLFSNKIKQSPTFAAWYAGNQLNSDIEFNRPEEDLFLSLHGADIYCINPEIGRFSIIDTYDFHANADFQNAIINLVNDGAWLLTECGVLHKISFAATFDYAP